MCAMKTTSTRTCFINGMHDDLGHTGRIAQTLVLVDSTYGALLLTYIKDIGRETMNGIHCTV